MTHKYFMKNILITGVSSWIWKFLTENLSQNYHIYWVSRSMCDTKNMTFIQWDIQDLHFLQEITSKIENCDYFICNAGVGFFDKFEKISLSEHMQQIQTNLLSPILLTSLLRSKIQKGIIFIWSISSKKSGKYGATYSASKFGLRGFAMNLKNEYPKLQIHLINPKIIDTWFHKNAQVEIVWKYQTSSPWDILKTIENIIDKKETRFEIDL